MTVLHYTTKNKYQSEYFISTQFFTKSHNYLNLQKIKTAKVGKFKKET